MANVSKSVKAVKKMVEVETEEVTYALELSFDELKALRAVFNKVGGSPTNSPRKHMDNMSNAIDTALGKDRWDWSWAQPEIDLLSGRQVGTYFNDYGSDQ